MTLSGVYGFWKYVSKLERRETRRYLEMFYTLKYRDLVSAVETLDLWICGHYGYLGLFSTTLGKLGEAKCTFV